MMMREGIVYTETVVYLAPERLAAEAPYQVAIVELAGGGRVTARVTGDRVVIGDKVSEVVIEDGVHFFQKHI